MDRLLLVPLIPLFSAVLLGVFGRRLGSLAGWLASASVFAALAVGAPMALDILANAHGAHAVHRVVAWDYLASRSLHVEVALRLDALSAIMLFVVLGIGGLIHVFAVGYMAEDPGRGRFFAYLNMFIVFMLTLILGDNLLMLFVGWEGVGLASYCLIGFWYQREAPRKAAIKAFVTNRVGDFSFMLGLFLLARVTGTIQFDDIFRAFAAGSPELAELAGIRFVILGIPVALPDLAALLLFFGACGKSAQFPLHVWLPDAMEGPTPVSALIHAATMVTAGVYMVVRLEPIFAAAPLARELMLSIAVLTAVGAALAALPQTDLKRIFAYSTISQLGFMMAAASVCAGGAAVFHLATHAVFKALLFLGAGSVIHAMHHAFHHVHDHHSDPQDIRNMGGLLRKLPVTSAVLIVGALGLAGVWPFAGFSSKDAIIVAVAEANPVRAALLFAAAVVTAFYSARALTVALFGENRTPHDAGKHLQDSPWVMLGPLSLLALGTLLARWLPIPHLLGDAEHHSDLVFWASVIVPVATALGGYNYYRNRLPESTAFSDFFKSGYRLDAFYERLFIAPLRRLAEWVKDVLDARGFDGVVHGVGAMGKEVGRSMVVFQTGGLGSYLCYIAGGAALLIWLVVQ